MSRELDDAILSLRTNELELGLWLFKTVGDPQAVVEVDRFVLDHQDDWFVREVLGMVRRTFARLDVSPRSMFAIVTPGSCFAGTLLELALASDRVYMLHTEEGEPSADRAPGTRIRDPMRTARAGGRCRCRASSTTPS